MNKLKLTAFAIAVFAAFVFSGSVSNVRAQSGSMEWSGTVDDVVQIRIRNRNARSTAVSGRAYNDDNYNFNGRRARNASLLCVLRILFCNIRSCP